MVPTATATRIDSNYWAAKAQPRVSVSSLARSKDWKERLSQEGLIEVLDRGDTCAWLVSPESMDALMAGYASYQDELEMASLKAMVDARTPGRMPLSGEALSAAAKGFLLSNLEELELIVNGG